MSKAQRSKTHTHQNLTPVRSHNRSSSVLICPEDADEGDIRRAECVIYPRRLSEAEFKAAKLFALESDCPIFIVPEDLKRFEKDGFGAYRFQLLGGFRQLGFSFGKLSFIPAKRRFYEGWQGALRELVDLWWSKQADVFHVFLDQGGKRSAFLSNPHVDASDMELLKKEGMEFLYRLNGYSEESWSHVKALGIAKPRSEEWKKEASF